MEFESVFFKFFVGFKFLFRLLTVISEKTYQTFNKKFKITPFNKHRPGINKV